MSPPKAPVKTGQRGSRLDEHADEIVAMKIAGTSNRKIAEHFGVSHPTLGEWLRKAEVEQLIDLGYKETIAQASRQLAAGAHNAVAALNFVLDPKHFKDRDVSDLIRAADVYLKHLGVQRAAEALENVGDQLGAGVVEAARRKAEEMERRVIEAEVVEVSQSSDGLRVVEGA